jgi:phosphoribosylglycinamide formyltransferase-1
MNDSARSSKQPLRIAALGSGKGSNLQSILDAIQAAELNATVKCVISDVADAYILERAREHGIAAHYVDAAPSRTKLEGPAEERVLTILQKGQVELVVLAGFMRIVKARLLNTYAGHIVNIHPSLLPAFPGLTAWKQALEYGTKITGCTVHFVDEGTDTGPIILQRSVPVLDDDTPESLHARIQIEEHKAYPEALRLIAEAKLRIDGHKVLRM